MKTWLGNHASPVTTRFTPRFAHEFPIAHAKRHGGRGELFLHKWTQAIQHDLHNFTTIIAMLMLETTSGKFEMLRLNVKQVTLAKIARVIYMHIVYVNLYIYIYIYHHVYIYTYVVSVNILQPVLINYSFQAPPSSGQADQSRFSRCYRPLNRPRDLIIKIASFCKERHPWWHFPGSRMKGRKTSW